MNGEPAKRAGLGWWRRLSLRARLTTLASLVVAVGLVAGSLLLLGSLERSLLDAVDTTARQRAQDVAALAASGNLPDPIPVAGAGTVLVQVVDSRDGVVAASVGSDRAVPLLSPSELAAADRTPRFLDGGRIGEREPLRVIAWPVGTAPGHSTVIAAVSITSVADSVRVIAVGLLIGGPVLLALFAVIAWFTVGWTLRPVASLRRGADEITGAGEARRLPLPAANDEIHRLGVTLNRMLDRLDQAASRQRGFVGDAAHELRSPLASMRAQLEVAVLHPDQASPTLAADLLADTLRLGRMVEDLLALARLDERAGRPEQGEVELGEVAREVAERTPTGGAEVRLDLDGGARVRGDRVALGRVVQNLLDNAVRYASSRVDVSVASSPDGLAVLSVADDGPGIPEPDRERVFERFTRLDDARSRDVGGAGLGLAIAREIVRAHGGELTAERAPRGALLVARLPAETADAPAGAGAAPPAS
jgi:signal transduction histidine kinase